MNWPVAAYMIQFLASHEIVVEKYLLEILKPEQKDDEWKRNIIRHLFPEWSSYLDNDLINTEIIIIANNPTEGERLEEADAAANDYLGKIRENQLK